MSPAHRGGPWLGSCWHPARPVWTSCGGAAKAARQWARLPAPQGSSYCACAAHLRYCLPSPYYRASSLCACAAPRRYCLPSPSDRPSSLRACAAHLRPVSPPLTLGPPASAHAQAVPLKGAPESRPPPERRTCLLAHTQAAGWRPQRPDGLLPSFISRSCPETRLDTCASTHTPLPLSGPLWQSWESGCEGRTSGTT